MRGSPRRGPRRAPRGLLRGVGSTWAARLREPRWGVLAASFATMVLVQGATFTFPIFLVPLAREFGGPRGVAAAAFSLHNLVVGLTATVVDPLMGRFGERRVFAAGALVLGAGLALSGTAESPLGIILWFSALGGLGAGLLGSVAQTLMLSRWFPTARGTVVGLALSGMGIGMFIFGPLSALLIERVGWRRAFLTLGIGVALLRLPTNARAAAPPVEAAGAGARPAGTAPEPRIAEILGTARFWCFAPAFFFTPVSHFLGTTPPGGPHGGGRHRAAVGGDRVRDDGPALRRGPGRIRRALGPGGPDPGGARELRGHRPRHPGAPAASARLARLAPLRLHRALRPH